jgi:hypothetical protein
MKTTSTTGPPMTLNNIRTLACSTLSPRALAMRADTKV